MKVEIYSDNICPWCFIGKRNFDQAVANLKVEDIQLQWKAYQLYPQIPREGVPRQAFMRARFGSGGGEAFKRIAAVGKDAGIDFVFGGLETIPNTLDSHRLVEYAASEGQQHQLVEKLMSAGFEQSRDIGSREVLLEIAAEAELDVAAVAAMLDSTQFEEEVQQSLQFCMNAGISGVPFFRLGNGEVISGAQPVAIFEMCLQSALEDYRASDNVCAL